MYYIYFLESLKNSKIYVGKTSIDPEIRLNQHNIGTNKWTKANRPFKLLYYESYLCKEDASRREAYYKMGFGKAIKKLIVKYIKEHNTGE